MSFFLAIDAGGTKTNCLLADETRVLARATTGTVKLMRVGEDEATSRLQAMLKEVAASAGVTLGQITRTCFGLAGVSIPAVRDWAGKAVAELVAGELLLCGDEEIALDAAFSGGAGVLVVAGTGSNAIGRAATGEIFGAGGWGPVLGDEGSGYWIGIEAIRAVLRARDIGKLNGALLQEIEREWRLESLGDVVAYANRRGDSRHPAVDFASLAPVVARCAERGDSLAVEVLQHAGDELAELVALVFQRMSAAATLTTEKIEVEVAYTGSVLTRIARVREMMIARLALLQPAARVRVVPVDPIEGALWRARR
jgi:N-acetylglucosamine kinase-like BadF-type ATPase